MNYYRDEINDSANENNDANNYRINKNETARIKSFEYKTKITGRTSNDNKVLGAEVVVLLKYFGKFWRSLDLPLINCGIELHLSWSRCCIISETSITPAVLANPSVPVIEPTYTTWTTFQINKAKFYVPFVTLAVNDNIKFLENYKTGI